MKKFTKFLGIVLIIALVMSMGISSAFAAKITINSTADPNVVKTDTTGYKAWKLLDADIEDASKITVDEETGEFNGATSGADVPKVAYYTTSATAKAALEATGLFTFTQVGSESKWYATAKTGLTAAEVTAAFANKTDDEMTAAFGEPATGAQTTPGGSAEISVTDPGYYLIKSTLGDELAVQTLADVTINTKNDYPTPDKELKTPTTDSHVQIGDDVTYTLTVEIPATANDVIVLTDVMDDGLTFKSIDDNFSNGTDDVAYTFAPEAKTAAAVTANDNTFTLTLSKEVVTENQGKTLTIDYVATVNNKAVVAVPEVNKVTLNYGNHFESKPKQVETETHSFSFDKVDGSNSGTKLTGAEFILTTDGTTPIDLVEVTAGEVYRIWMSEDGDAAKLKDATIITAGKTITINGVDSDVTYKLVETKAPAGGYNQLTEPVTVTVDEHNTTHENVENNKGTVLPSTGGIGTTIFYVVGSILVVAAGVLLITKKRMSREG